MLKPCIIFEGRGIGGVIGTSTTVIQQRRDRQNSFAYAGEIRISKSDLCSVRERQVIDERVSALDDQEQSS